MPNVFAAWLYTFVFLRYKVGSSCNVLMRTVLADAWGEAADQPFTAPANACYNETNSDDVDDDRCGKL